MDARWSILALAVLLVALAGCSSKSGGGTEVAIHGSAFDPATLTVSPGEKVTWVNHDGFDHSTTSTLWDSGDLGQGETYTVEMPNEPGTYAYHCKFHGAMHGTIVVR